MKNLMIIISTIAFFVQCNRMKGVSKIFEKNTAYTEYKNSLVKLDLHKTTLGRKWIQAGKQALVDSLFIPNNYTEKGYFSHETPSANSYRFKCKTGEILKIQVTTIPRESVKLFMDLFSFNNDKWIQESYGNENNTMFFEVIKPTDFLLRIQPELLRDVQYILTVSTGPSLQLPVEGATNKSIGSFYGDIRAEGKRKHEGIDIFAKKGTYVIAPSNGVVTKVGSNNLGGNVVWVFDNKRFLNYYFAHLDSQFVKPGQFLKTGEAIGSVGNTGNAIKTVPHLHFGIYDRKSIDPLPFIWQNKDLKAISVKNSIEMADPQKVTAEKLNFRSGPGEHFKSNKLLTKNTYLKILAHSHDWVLVELPDFKKGFVSRYYLQNLGTGKEFLQNKPTILYNTPKQNAIPKAEILAQTPLKKLAEFNGYFYVSTPNFKNGWILPQ